MRERLRLDPIQPLKPAHVGFALGTVLLAGLLTWEFAELVSRNTFLLFLLAVLASSLFAGLWGGVLATALGCVGLLLTVIPPVGSLAVESAMDGVRIVSFAGFGLLIAVLAQLLHAALRRATEHTEDARLGEESLRTLFDSTADAIYVTNADGKLIDVNRAALELHGFGAAQMLEHPWHAFVDPDLNDLALIGARIDAALAGTPQSYEVWVRHASGRSFPMEMHLSAARYFGRDVVIAIGRDLSERRRLESQLRQSQKMDAIGRLAGGVAHDFNNLLTSIRGYASLMRDRVAHDRTLLEDLDEIEHAVDLAVAVTSQLLAFSRKQDYAPKAVSLNESLDDMSALLRRLIGERVALVVDKDPELGLAMLDEGQIEQVVMNLAVNARDATGGEGRIVIRTSNAMAGSPPTPHVVLTVSDNGVGMDEATRARIFEPFFTTKESGHGTGLGLSTVYGIVKQSGGQIEVESELGAGSTFTVMFPRIDPAAQRSEPGAETSDDVDAHDGVLNGRRRTILLAEDEMPVRKLVCRILTRRGYRVIEAADGREALERLNEYDGTIDALVTDVVMPHLTGPELAERLRTDRPDLPVLFTSGYNEEGMAGTGVVSGLGIAFLQKPFVPEELVRLLGELLEAN